ncbi:BF2992 family fimbrillin-A clan protein [Phocaeicola barnesiae]|uniref:BF2992 family fimbrillin-A clan protein n=1 Tax=Phocaeicola barnesiae TaxID=376804 RepID=A0AAW5N5I5_9BACT|nr:BF2992 family fimbrillin-A clan protein [Phocaeicola barnesiae]MCR8874015.1 BF2992 family fimbrillin-A clan protein [Phocaeicola barnesiae]
MKRIIIIGILTGILTACNTEEETPVRVPEGKVQIEFQLPGTYGIGVSDAQSRADNLPDAGGKWHNLPPASTGLLPIGSTLWLSYDKQNKDGATYGTPNLQGYVVGTTTGGYNTLYPCTTQEVNGKLEINPEEIGAPLYLEGGTYKFKMISPAYPVSTDLKMNIDNGMYLYSTDGRYEETYSQPILIEVNTSGVQYVKLNPIISQVARFTFTIHKGTGVYTLEPLEAGIEISGLQNPFNHGAEGLQYNWSSENIADTLVMRIGDKRSWVTLPGSELETETDGTITGDIGVLPTLTMSTPVAVLINMAVNGVPTQYMTLVNETHLLHARSYNFDWTVNVEDGQISVVTWQNQSWTTDIIRN